MNKRLFKKKSFLLVCALVPLLVFGVRLLSGQDSGIVRISLCMKDPADELSAEIVQKIMDEDDDVLHYRLCESEEEARKQVISGKADAAWIFPENLKRELQKAADSGRPKPVVTVIEREESVTLMFTREILTSLLFPAFSYAVYENFIREDIGITEVSQQELQEAYERALIEGSIFQMVYLDGQLQEKDHYTYLQAPLRGILAVWFVLCGFAASLYFMQDEKKGFLACVPVKDRLWAALGEHAVLLSDAMVILVIACRLAGVFTMWHKELLSVILLGCSTLVFCNLLRLLCGTPERLGSSIPILTIGMLVLCPVFINIKKVKLLKYAFPPYYYLNAIHDTYAMIEMLLYTGVVFGLCILLFRWKNRNIG